MSTPPTLVPVPGCFLAIAVLTLVDDLPQPEEPAQPPSQALSGQDLVLLQTRPNSETTERSLGVQGASRRRRTWQDAVLASLVPCQAFWQTQILFEGKSNHLWFRFPEEWDIFRDLYLMLEWGRGFNGCHSIKKTKLENPQNTAIWHTSLNSLHFKRCRRALQQHRA